MMLGVRWAGDDGKMAVDSELEEEWSRLHDMRINTNGENGILEYTGKGKTIRWVFDWFLWGKWAFFSEVG